MNQILRWLRILIDCFNDGADGLHGLPPLDEKFRLERTDGDQQP